ncbi:MAG: GntR family transcriptional regulator [Candidatus Latescibacterota bacterium]
MHKPLHVTATDRLRKVIASDAFREGDRLPTEPLLAKELGISRATLREALKQLESEGLLNRVHGVGTFILAKRPAISVALSIPRSITEMIESIGLMPGTALMEVNTETVFPDDVERLKVRPGSNVFRIVRVRTANGQPVAYTIDVVPAWVMKKYPMREGEQNFSLIEHLRRHCGVVFARSKHTLIPLHNVQSVADKLEIDPSSHIFFFEGFDTSSEGIPVLHSREYFSPWIFRFSVERKA